MRKYQPFPYVPTDVTLATAELGNDDPSMSVRNLSVTATTLFTLHATSPDCRLRITHARSTAPRVNVSRVRVDSLVLYATSDLVWPCPRLDDRSTRSAKVAASSAA